MVDVVVRLPGGMRAPRRRARSKGLGFGMVWDVMVRLPGAGRVPGRRAASIDWLQ